MARPLMWLGVPSNNTSAVLIVRSLTNGSVSVAVTDMLDVAVTGSPFSATADTAVQDGLVKISITGLTAGTQYKYTVTNPNADTGNNVLKTLPASGANVKIAYYSCRNSKHSSYFLRVMNQDPDVVVCIGDFGYYSGGGSWGTEYPSSNPSNSTTVSDYWQANANFRAFPYYRKMAEQYPFAMVPDDHEWDNNNVSWDDLSASTAIIDAYATGTTDYMIGNPVNGDSPGDANPLYFRFTCGNTEVFVLSAVLHGVDATDVQHMMRDAPASGAGMLGRDAASTNIKNQETWLLAKLATSTAKYKLILNPKQTLKATNTNADSWSVYSTEMDRVLQAIHDNSSGWTTPGGVIWGCGDWHSPSIHRSTNGTHTKTYDHVAVTACPMQGAIRDAGTASEYTVYHYTGENLLTGDRTYDGLFGLMSTNTSQITGSIINFSGDTLASIAVNSGENKAA